jgi:hypothetical protein
MASSINLTLEIKMAKAKSTTTTKAKALMANRVKYLIASLANKGITPTKVTQSLVSTGAANNLLISAKYVN